MFIYEILTTVGEIKHIYALFLIFCATSVSAAKNIVFWNEVPSSDKDHFRPCILIQKTFAFASWIFLRVIYTLFVGA